MRVSNCNLVKAQHTESNRVILLGEPYPARSLYQWFMNKANVEDDSGLTTYENTKH